MIDITGFIHQIKNDLVFDAFTELVGVDVATKNLQAGGLVLLEQRGTGETNEDGIGQQRLHHTVQLAVLAAVAFIHENKEFTYRWAGLSLKIFEIGLKVIDPAHAELVHQRAEQPGCGLT